MIFYLLAFGIFSGSSEIFVDFWNIFSFSFGFVVSQFRTNCKVAGSNPSSSVVGCKRKENENELKIT